MSNAFIAVEFDTIRVKIEFMAVPDSSAFVPLFARTPVAVIKSSMDTPSVLAAPPDLTSERSNCSAFVFALLFAMATLSRYVSIPSTPTPTADMESVTRSDVVFNSPFVAAVVFSIGFNAFNCVLTSQPASAIYFIASADSAAVNFVVCPASIAAFFCCSYWLVVAPEMACSSFI